jgi:hypothetical protein
MCEILQRHLNEKTPYFEPIKFEIMNDGPILARFAYKTSYPIPIITTFT